jgi:large subunit ribosomal protein L1
MPKQSKRRTAIRQAVEAGRLYSAGDALDVLKGFTPIKFPATVEVSVNLGVDPRKSDQVVRGSTVLPHGTGKVVKIAVFAQGAHADAARAAGADLVGLEDLAEAVKGGEIAFDVAIATPDAMRVVGKLGQILGPRGLMPNPKVGTVTADVATAVADAKAGQVRYRTDRAGIVHCGIGKLSFDSAALKENLEALLVALRKGRPSAAKGVYIKRITLSSTMGPGVPVDQASLAA